MIGKLTDLLSNTPKKLYNLKGSNGEGWHILALLVTYSSIVLCIYF